MWQQANEDKQSEQSVSYQLTRSELPTKSLQSAVYTLNLYTPKTSDVLALIK